MKGCYKLAGRWDGPKYIAALKVNVGAGMDFTMRASVDVRVLRRLLTASKAGCFEIGGVPIRVAGTIADIERPGEGTPALDSVGGPSMAYYQAGRKAYFKVVKGRKLKEPAQRLLLDIRASGKKPPKWVHHVARFKNTAKKNKPARFDTFLRSAATALRFFYKDERRAAALEKIAAHPMMRKAKGYDPGTFLKRASKAIEDLANSIAKSKVFKAAMSVLKSPIFQAAIALVPGVGPIVAGAALAIAATTTAAKVYDAVKDGKISKAEAGDLLDQAAKIATDKGLTSEQFAAVKKAARKMTVPPELKPIIRRAKEIGDTTVPVPVGHPSAPALLPGVVLRRGMALQRAENIKAKAGRRKPKAVTVRVPVPRRVKNPALREARRLQKTIMQLVKQQRRAFGDAAQYAEAHA